MQTPSYVGGGLLGRQEVSAEISDEMEIELQNPGQNQEAQRMQLSAEVAQHRYLDQENRTPTDQVR